MNEAARATLIAPEQATLVREVARFSDLASLLGGDLAASLDAFAHAARRMQRAVEAGQPADPTATLVAYGSVSALAELIRDRLAVAGAAIDDLAVEVAVDPDARPALSLERRLSGLESVPLVMAAP